MQMRILILDDQQARHDRFAIALRGHDVTHCCLFSEYTAALQSGRYDLVLLDHDLGDAIEQERVVGPYSSRAYDGVDAAEHLAALPSDTWPGQVVIHSWNPDGAKAMKRVLWDAGMRGIRMVPFGAEFCARLGAMT